MTIQNDSNGKVKDISSMLVRLQQWYHSMCDGDWEHCYGVKIETSDNPGWIVEIDIIDTPLENKPFDPIHNGETDDNYFICKIENGKFEGCGDATKLENILKVFLNWAEENTNTSR